MAMGTNSKKARKDQKRVTMTAVASEKKATLETKVRRTSDGVEQKVISAMTKHYWGETSDGRC